MRPETEPWWRQGQADLQAADVNWRAGLYYAVSWFAQQAAEKGLKALYAEQGKGIPPRTHVLKFLGAEVGAPPTVEADLIALLPAFDMARYPNAAGVAPVDAVTAGDHLAATRRILAWIAHNLPSP